MPLNTKFTKFTTSSAALASYNWVDLASGISYIDFYGYSTTNGAYRLLNQTIYSNDPDSTGDINSTLELEFDSSEFTLATTVTGVSSISLGYAVKGFRDPCTVSCTVGVYHYDGTTETQLGSTQTTSTVSGDPPSETTTTYAGNSTVAIDLGTKLFSRGDLLRLKVVATSTGTNDYASIAHSPNNLDGSAVNTTNGADYTQLKISVPFKVDL